MNKNTQIRQMIINMSVFIEAGLKNITLLKIITPVWEGEIFSMLAYITQK